MTTDSAIILFDSTTDANFRAWGGRVAQMLSACGLIQAADTGQINWTTVTRPVLAGGSGGATEVLVGYEIWRFNDALQATKPIFIKIEYGFVVDTTNGATGSPQSPSLYITTASASNGAGTLNGTLVGTRTRMCGGSGSYNNGGAVGTGAASTTSPCYASGSGDGFWLALGITAAAQVNYQSYQGTLHYPSFPAFFIVERSRGTDGQPNGDGFVTMTARHNAQTVAAGTTVVPTFQVTSFTHTLVSARDDFWPIAWSGSNFGTANFAGDLYFFPLSVATPKAQAQSLAVLGTWKNDVPLLSPQVVTVLGAPHTYLSMAGIAGALAANNLRSKIWDLVPNGAIMLRYE